MNNYKNSLMVESHNISVYVASSWRNKHQPEIITKLRKAHIMAYDFRNPRPKDTGFNWKEIDPDWEKWDLDEYFTGLCTCKARDGFNSDFNAMKHSNVCLLVLPCGRSAHLEAGWMKGKGKKLIIYSPEMHEPELMYLMADMISGSMEEILKYLGR